MSIFGQMAKASKKAAPKKRGNYDKPIKVKGNIFEVLKASMDNANKKSATKSGSKQ